MDSRKIDDIINNRYDTVSAGEVCTIQKAKDLGIYDSSRYFKSGSGYEKDVKVYNSKYDKANVHTKTLCSTAGVPDCGVEFGYGFVKKPGYPGKCIAPECPTGFVETRAGVCKKPLEDALLQRRSKCDERWHDWFSTPNYHLGNKYYNEKEGQCYSPCPPGHVPAFAQDPVDGSSVDFTSKNTLDKCVSRENYFGGKYAQGSEFCPIAWIARMNATPESIRLKTETLRNDAVKPGAIQNPATLERYKTLLTESSVDLSKRVTSMKENVVLDDIAQVGACRGMNTPERLREAYAVCNRINTDEDRYLVRLSDESPGTSDAENANRMQVTKQACNALFCNSKLDPYVADTIGRDPICFKNPANVKLNEDSSTGPAPPNAADGPKFVRKMVGYAIIIVFASLIALFCYYGFSRFIWPKILRPLLRFLKRLFTGWKEDQRADEVRDSIDRIGKPRV